MPSNYNQALVLALWIQIKALHTTIGIDVATLQNDLAAMESLRSQIAAPGVGGSHVAEFEKQSLSQLTQGYVPYVLTPGGAVRITVFAVEPNTQRDLSLIDRRQMSAIDPSLT